MNIIVLCLCLLAVSGTEENNRECTLDTCHAINSFRRELEAIKQQILGQEEDTELKKLERRLRSLEQTSRFYLSQFNNKIAINLCVVSLDNFVCRRQMVKLCEGSM